jgi:hypothetical protein
MSRLCYFIGHKSPILRAPYADNQAFLSSVNGNPINCTRCGCRIAVNRTGDIIA